MEQATPNQQQPSAIPRERHRPDRNELIERFAPLVHKVARKIAARLPQSVEIDDLIGSGVPGLIDAVDRFDPSKGASFSSYAEIRIRGAILDELRSLDWVPRSVRAKLARVEAVYAALEQDLGRSPTEEEAAVALGIDTDTLLEFLGRMHPISVVSFEDLGLGTEREQRCFLQSVRDEGEQDIQTRLRLGRLRRCLTEAIEALPEKQRIVISLYYYEDLNLKEIGKILGVTESRACQLHTQAVLTLRRSLEHSSLRAEA